MGSHKISLLYIFAKFNLFIHTSGAWGVGGLGTTTLLRVEVGNSRQQHPMPVCQLVQSSYLVKPERWVANSDTHFWCLSDAIFALQNHLLCVTVGNKKPIVLMILLCMDLRIVCCCCCEWMSPVSDSVTNPAISMFLAVFKRKMIHRYCTSVKPPFGQRKIFDVLSDSDFNGRVTRLRGEGRKKGRPSISVFACACSLHSVSFQSFLWNTAQSTTLITVWMNWTGRKQQKQRQAARIERKWQKTDIIII